MTLNCPKCGKQIDSASVNVAQDMAFCAPCGEMHKISVLTAAAPVTEPQISHEEITEPAAKKPISESVQPPVPASSASRFCTKCGAQINDGVKFCVKCGSPVSSPVQIAVPAETAPCVYKAKFHHLNNQMYCCELYSGEEPIGRISYIKDIYFSDTQKWLMTIYPGIGIEVQ